MNYSIKPFQRTPRVFPTGEESREHIVFEDAPAVYRERLSAKIGGKSIKDVFLYEPDPKDVTPVEVAPIVKFGGLFTNGNLYMEEAIATAQTGRQYVTWITNRHLSVRAQLFDERHRKSPYLRTAQNGHAVIKAVLARTDAGRVRTSGHSYAGMTLTEAAAHSGEYIESMVMQDPAGIGTHAVRYAELWNNELKPAAPHFLQLQNKPPEMVANTLRHITDNPLLALRELVGLMEPDMRPNLERAKEKGVKTGLLILGQSAIFNARHNMSVAETEKMFHLVQEVPEAWHIDPNINPAAIVEAQNTMFDELARLDTPHATATHRHSRRGTKKLTYSK